MGKVGKGMKQDWPGVAVTVKTGRQAHEGLIILFINSSFHMFELFL